jgi:putative tributyrin esterase
VACGADDFLYGANLAFLDIATRRGIDVTSDLGPGDHDWAYWDEQIRRVLAWLPLSGQTSAPARG